jgi:hypothetical protein
MLLISKSWFNVTERQMGKINACLKVAPLVRFVWLLFILFIFREWIKNDYFYYIIGFIIEGYLLYILYFKESSCTQELMRFAMVKAAYLKKFDELTHVKAAGGLVHDCEAHC